MEVGIAAGSRSLSPIKSAFLDRLDQVTSRIACEDLT